MAGHLTRILSDDEDAQRPAFGLVCATPSKAVLQLLGMEPAVKEVASGPAGSLRVPALGEGESHAFVCFRETRRNQGRNRGKTGDSPHVHHINRGHPKTGDSPGCRRFRRGTCGLSPVSQGNMRAVPGFYGFLDHRPRRPEGPLGRVSPTADERHRALAFHLDQNPVLLALWNLGPGYIEKTVEDWNSEEWPVETIPLAAR